MLGKTFTLFRVLGFSVKADLSWLVIVALVVWSLAGGLFPAEFPGLGDTAYLLMGLAGALGLFVSVVLHELSHSLVARLYGLPIRGITLFIFGGVAEMTEEPPSPKSEFLMALAGPVASLVIAAGFAGAALAGGRAGLPIAVTAVAGWLGLINALLAAFNMIPGFPLDGGRVLRSILWYSKRDLQWATHVATQAGSVFGLALMGLGFFSVLSGNPIGGLWWILIGLFLRGAAKQSYQQVLIRKALSGEPVNHFMNPTPVTVPPGITLAELVNDYVYRYHYKMFPVADDGRLLGCVTTNELQQVPQEQWPARTVSEVAQSCSPENTLSADEQAMAAFARMSANHISRMMVVDHDRLVGILTLKDLLKFLSLKLQLGAPPPRPA